MRAFLKSQGIVDPEIIFLNTLMQLPQRVQVQAKPLIDSTGKDKMKQLRDIVDSLYSMPAEARLKKLLESTSMGDMRPSEYLRHIRELQGSDSDRNSPLIRTYFIQSLPSNIAPFVHLMLDRYA